MSDAYKVAGDIRRNLHTIRDYYEAALRGSRGADENAALQGADAGEPLNLHAVDTRRATHTDLSYWVRFILDNVNDGKITNRMRADGIPELSAFVDTWALALAEQLPDDAVNCANDTSRHGRALEGLAKGWASKRILIPGRCPELLFVVSAQGIEELVPCEGELWSVFREEDNGLLPRSVQCDADKSHEWEPHDWTALGRRIGTFIQATA